MALSASMVGSSCWDSDVKVDAPMLSPALMSVLFGFSAFACWNAPEITAAPAVDEVVSSRPWKSLME